MKNQWTEQEVTIKGAYDLAATLTCPKGLEGPLPAMVIVCGTGEGDRDGNIKKLKANLNIYKMLSDFYAGLGFVTLRYDKRGVAQSKGDKLACGMNDLVDDVISNVEYLRSLPYVDPQRILLLGHSEGCILTTLAHGRSPISGLLLVSGAGTSIKSAMLYQNLGVYEEIRQKKGLSGFILRCLITEKTALTKLNKLFSAVLSSQKDVIRFQGMKFPAKWLREHLDIKDEKVLEWLKAYRIPILAVTGDKDVQADPETLKEIEALNNPTMTCAVIPNMDHLLREYTGEKSVLNAKKQYWGEMDKPLNQTFLDTMEKWVGEHFLDKVSKSVS